MKNCFMKKLLSSFLALTMVVTAVPANVVSAADEQAQVVKAQNNKPAAAKAAKKVISWSNKAKTGVVAACAALALSVAAAVQATLYFRLNLAKKEIEGLNEKLDGQNKNLDDQANKFNDQLDELKALLNGVTNQTARQIDDVRKIIDNKANPAEPQMDNIKNTNLFARIVSSVLIIMGAIAPESLGRGIPTFLGIFIPLAIDYSEPVWNGTKHYGDKALNGTKYYGEKALNGTKYYTEEGWNSTSTFFGNLVNGNSTKTSNRAKPVPTSRPTPTPTQRK